MPPKRVIAWALYDWANSAFATTVIAGFFPLFFKLHWSAGADPTESTFRLGLANSVASIVIVLLAPVLGAIADRGGARKRFLLFFATMGIIMTGGLYLVEQGSWAVAMALYALGMIGFSGGNVFYDALIVEVADDAQVDFVSALGFAMGYLGGGLLFAFDVLMTLYPDSFGLADRSEAVRVAFLSVALWWALFSVPVFLLVPEPIRPRDGRSWTAAVRGGFAQLAATFAHLRQLRMTFLFLLAYWLYIDGVDTIVRMAVDYGITLGFDSNGLIVALLITQFVGFPAALAFGRLGQRWGAKRAILLAIGVYVLVVAWAYRMQQSWEFYGLAVAIGLVQGGIQSLSRSFYARLIPRDKCGEFFGFYNMLGKFAAVIGPALMGWVSLATGNPRLSILSISVLFILGAGLLLRVDECEGHRQARVLEEPA